MRMGRGFEGIRFFIYFESSGVIPPLVNPPNVSGSARRLIYVPEAYGV